VIRVFLIAGSLLARAGLENLPKAKAVKIARTAANLEAAETLLSDAEADVVLIDTAGEQPEQFIESIVESGLASELPVVVLAEHLPQASSAAALRAGVRALLPSDVAPDQLVAALEAAASGLVVMHPTDVEAMLPAPAPAASRATAELVEPLTRRELEVLQMLAAGLGNKEIAVRLAISEHTVKFHVAAILGKLGAENRTEAVSLGIRRRLILL